MNLIHSVILYLFFKARSCQLQCVKELIQKPDVWVPLMAEGRAAILQCVAFPFCSEKPNIHWNWTKTSGQSKFHYYDYYDYDDEEWHGRSALRLTPTADDHNTNITCVADYGHTAVETTVTLTVIFSPKILHSSQCTIEGKLLVCACISWGNPPPPITWPLASFTDFSVNSFSSIQTVTSTFTMPAADYHNTSVKCISSNELGQAEIDIPLQNDTENSRLNNGLDSNHKSDAVLPWIITGVSLILNLALLTGLIICTYKRCRGESKQKEVCEEMNTYASLNRAHVEQDYGVISPQTRGVHRERPGVVRATPDNWPPRVPPHNPK